MKPTTPTLDAILSSKPNDAAPSAAEMDRRRALVEAAEAAIIADAAPLVDGEQDATTLEALAMYYDVKRDRHIMQLAKLGDAYGAEMEKRELTAVHAGPLLVEMDKALAAAMAAQARALRHRAAAGTAKSAGR